MRSTALWTTALALGLAVVAGCGGDSTTDGGGGKGGSGSTSGTSSTGGASGSGGAGSLGQLGDACMGPAECSDGACIDLKTLDDGCAPLKFCTQPCTSAAQCPTFEGGAADCDGGVCIYVPWFTAAGCG